MTNDQNRYRAFVATLIAIVIMFTISCVLAGMGKNIEAIGVGSTIVGLVGLAGVLAAGKQQNDTVDDTLRTALEHLASSTPAGFKSDVREGARAGTREGVEDALDTDSTGEREILR